jgi:proline dehydrogenase
MIDFSNTENAFEYKSNSDLKRAFLLFKMVEKPFISKFLTSVSLFLMKFHFPVHWFIKPLMFSHFCGGANRNEALKTVQHLSNYNVFSVLDFAVEGLKNDNETEKVVDEIKRTIDLAAENPNIAFAVFKPTALAPAEMLEKINNSITLTIEEFQLKEKFENRFNGLCDYAAQKSVRILIDAEEFCYQDYVDHLCGLAMLKHNKSNVYVYTTLQMYRTDRLDYLKKLISEAKSKDFKIGVKFVRGAYLEKERNLAAKNGYNSPVFEVKSETDNAYDAAVALAFENIDRVFLFLGTHNQMSIEKAMETMKKLNLNHSDKRVFFAQLYGMSDNLSFNLSKNKYNVAKYLPYGPVKVTIPYLLRRAQENTAVAGQTSRELQFIENEMKRRKAK